MPTVYQCAFPHVRWQNPGCNNRACGYDGGDCTTEQILTKCRAVPEKVDYTSKPPGNRTRALTRAELSLSAGFNGSLTQEQAGVELRAELIQVNFMIEAEPANLVLLDDFNKMILWQEFTYTLQWSDPRLFAHPCYGGLQTVLSMSREDANSDIGRASKGQSRTKFWIPHLTVEPLTPGFDPWDEEVEVVLEADGEWNGGISPSPGAVQDTHLEHTVQWVGEMEVQVMQDFLYGNYPFDHQVMSTTFSVSGADLFSCGRFAPLPAGATLDGILPTTGEWLFDGPAEEAIHSAHPMLTDPITGLEYEDLSSCVLSIAIRRDYSVFVVKSLATSIGVVFVSLVAVLTMHPQDLMGDRFSVLFSALRFIKSITKSLTPAHTSPFDTHLHTHRAPTYTRPPKAPTPWCVLLLS